MKMYIHVHATCSTLSSAGSSLYMYMRHAVHVLCLLQAQAVDDIPTIMDALFECTLEMVSKNLEDFPEHRTNFFRMLQSVTQHCFPGERQ